MKNDIDVAFAFLYAVRKSLTNFVPKIFVRRLKKGLKRRDLGHISGCDDVSVNVSARRRSLALAPLEI